jgi:hypothetical protein
MMETAMRVVGPAHQLPDDETAFGRAVAKLLSARYPVHTSGHVAQDLRCTKKAAENILSGHLSARTMTRLAKAHGLGLLIEAGAAVTGQSLENFIHARADEARREQAAAEERHAADLALLQVLGQVGPRDPGGMGRGP